MWRHFYNFFAREVLDNNENRVECLTVKAINTRIVILILRNSLNYRTDPADSLQDLSKSSWLEKNFGQE